MTEGIDGGQPFVPADWLVAALDRGDTHVLDVREPWEYEGIGHLPDAVNVPFDRFRDDGDADEGMLPGPRRFADLVGGAGIGPDDAIVAYDDEHGVYAARVVVTAQLYGHARAGVLDGDYTAWIRDHPTETGVVAPDPVDYPVPGPVDRPLIDAAGVQRAAEDPAVTLVDTRTVDEFAAGHIEGAIQLDWRDLLDPATRGVLHPDALRDELAARGIVTDRPVVLYCNTARRLSHTYLALRHAGFEDVTFYEGSLTEWRTLGLDLVTTTA